MSDDGERATFYAGAADIELYRTETANYRDNLAIGAPLLWVVLRPAEGDPPYELATVTADPAEGEAMTESGSQSGRDRSRCRSPIQETIAAFVAEHHVEQDVREAQARSRQS